MAVAIGAINLLTVLLFRIDKDRASDGRVSVPHRRHLPRIPEQRRIPEGDLLLLAALGGTPGAYAARRIFRHKTRKQPFSAKLHRIAAIQLVALAALVGWFAFA